MHSLLSLGKLLLCVYLTSILFVFVVLGPIGLACGFSIFKLLRYLREELLIVLGTSSSESVLPRMMVKMERLGCAKPVVGLVIPAGYSFNLDGTSIYLTIAALFIAQATNTHLSFRQQLFILAILMLNSKGAATVTGGGFITLAATLSALGTIPVAGIALLLGVDRFMSEMRSLDQHGRQRRGLHRGSKVGRRVRCRTGAAAARRRSLGRRLDPQPSPDQQRSRIHRRTEGTRLTRMQGQRTC